jgi:hypothetical protein
MRFAAAVCLRQLGVLTGPDPAQMKKAPDLGFHAVEHGFTLPATVNAALHGFVKK